MQILIFTNQYGKTNNFVKGFTDNHVIYHSIYPTGALEASEENISKFLDRHKQFTLQSVEFIDGIVKWNTVETVYED